MWSVHRWHVVHQQKRCGGEHITHRISGRNQTVPAKCTNHKEVGKKQSKLKNTLPGGFSKCTVQQSRAVDCAVLFLHPMDYDRH